MKIVMAIVVAFLASATWAQNIFFDSFNGTQLRPHWQQPPPEHWEHTVGGGQLTVTDRFKPGVPCQPNTATITAEFPVTGDFFPATLPCERNQHVGREKEALMAGSWEPLQPFGPPPQPGASEDVTSAIHLIHLPNGKFLTFDIYNTRCRLWTPPPITAPGRGTFERKPQTHNEFFCGGHCALADGREFVVGGAWGVGGYASKKADVFDTPSGAWNKSPYPPPDMNYNRWYPTCTMLGNNSSGQPHLKILVTLGTINRDAPGSATVCELYDPYYPPVGKWTLGQDIGIGGTYPFIFVLPDGRIFCAGPIAQTRILDANLSAWADYPTNGNDLHTEDDHCSAVMFEPGKILKVGGSSGSAADAVKTVSFIDMTSPSPAWQLMTPMENPRRNHNLTLLPDGKVLITGGNLNGPTDFPVLPAELYDPVANTMTTLLPMDDDGPRWYHSTAGLLPDGRVVVAGGRDTPSQQIFRPPYLDGSPARPVIAGAPTSMIYATAYTVTYTPTTMAITKAVLIKLCSVTHSFCQDQRLVPLTVVSSTGGTVVVTSPVSANIAPPGYYMLFLLNSVGVPSESVYVRVGP